MLRYATYRTQVYTVLAAATGLQATRLPAAALSSLPDYFRAGLSPHDAADRLIAGGPTLKTAPAPREESSAGPQGRVQRHPQPPIPDPQEEK